MIFPAIGSFVIGMIFGRIRPQSWFFGAVSIALPTVLWNGLMFYGAYKESHKFYWVYFVGMALVAIPSLLGSLYGYTKKLVSLNENI